MIIYKTPDVLWGKLLSSRKFGRECDYI